MWTKSWWWIRYYVVSKMIWDQQELSSKQFTILLKSYLFKSTHGAKSHIDKLLDTWRYLTLQQILTNVNIIYPLNVTSVKRKRNWISLVCIMPTKYANYQNSDHTHGSGIRLSTCARNDEEQLWEVVKATVG